MAVVFPARGAGEFQAPSGELLALEPRVTVSVVNDFTVRNAVGY